jgi:hypothetical protein
MSPLNFRWMPWKIAGIFTQDASDKKKLFALEIFDGFGV